MFDILVQATMRASCFPLDMLRYDEAFPFSVIDVQHILETFKPEHKKGLTVQLRGRLPPTIKRWESFGWVVVSFQSVKGEGSSVVREWKRWKQL